MADLEGDPLIQLGVAGALSREIGKDGLAFLEYFARAVQAAFPNHADLKHQGGFLSKKHLNGIALTLGDDVYTLQRTERGDLSASRTHVVRGIALKTEHLAVNEWLAEVSNQIESHLATDERARSALASALGLA